ncbi:MAG: hypothetical protein R3336_09010, partial [Phycisphaeraceae bacterium]|nr:hypothetical protein [Phycisphaeraceae bacterium]
MSHRNQSIVTFFFTVGLLPTLATSILAGGSAITDPITAEVCCRNPKVVRSVKEPVAAGDTLCLAVRKNMYADCQGSPQPGKVVMAGELGWRAHGESPSLDFVANVSGDLSGRHKGRFQGKITGCFRGSGGGGVAGTVVEKDWDVTVVTQPLNLMIQNLPDESADTPHESDPGGFIALNDDDDDQDGNPDHSPSQATPVAGEDNLVPMEIKIGDDSSASRLTLSTVNGADRVVLWEDPRKKTRLGDGTTRVWDLSRETPPEVVYIEGVKASSAQGDVEFSLTMTTSAGEVSDKGVKATVLTVELIDARTFGIASSQDGEPILQTDDLRQDVEPTARVAGAVTDGSSLLVIRLQPEVDNASFDLELAPVASTITADPYVLGSLFEAGATLPPLPAGDRRLTPEPGQKITLASSDGTVFYRPPNNFLMGAEGIESR